MTSFGRKALFPPAEGSVPLRRHVLVLDVPRLSSRLALCRTPPLVIEVAPGALSAELLDRIAPDCIAFSLFSMRIDSHSLLRLLRGMGYRQRLFAITPRLPDPRMVMAELRSHSDGLRLRLLTLD